MPLQSSGWKTDEQMRYIQTYMYLPLKTEDIVSHWWTFVNNSRPQNFASNRASNLCIIYNLFISVLHAARTLLRMGTQVDAP